MPFWRKKNWEDEYDQYYQRDIERKELPSKFRYIPHALTVLLLSGIFFAVVAQVSGPTMVEKMLIALAMPVGLLWLALLVTIYFCLVNRQAWPAILCFGCWLLLTIAGNGPFSNWLAWTMESKWQDQESRLETEPVDVLVVLGGGTGTRHSGTPQLTYSGDRIAEAAKAWHVGGTKKVMCTGVQSFRTTEKDLHPYEEAARLLEDLGVEPADILKLKGENTFEEIENLKKWADANPDKQIGLLTSAWHLSRAMRLVRSHGLTVRPVPSHFLSDPFAPGPDVIIPGEWSLQRTAIITKEYLAWWMSR